MVIVRRNGRGTEFLNSTLIEWAGYGLAVFLILFPKGGFKLGPIPLTWGYGLVGFSILLGIPFWLLKGSSGISRGTVGAFLFLAPLQFLFLYSLIGYGVDTFGFALSDFINFFVLPFAFLLIFPPLLQKIRLERLITVACWMVFLAAAYGIFLFIWRFATGKYIEIPFLTVNVGDIGTLDDKYNARPDGLFKLISTYNNGNQYGVATLLLLPLLERFDPSRFRKLVVKAALMLTLSRTVWVGLILNETINLFRHLGYDLWSSRQLAVRYSSLFRFVRLALLSLVVLGTTLFLSGVSFLFDSTLGGRAAYFDELGHVTLLPTAPVSGFGEIVYVTAIIMLGWAGLGAIILLFCSPLLLAIVFKELRNTPLKIAALQGLVLYIALAAMDGALNYIPTMAFYWFLWTLLVYDGSNQADLTKKVNSCPQISPISSMRTTS